MPYYQLLLIEFVFWKPGRHLSPVLAFLVSCCQYHQLLPFVSLRFRHTDHGVSGVLLVRASLDICIYTAPCKDEALSLRPLHCPCGVPQLIVLCLMQNSWQNELEGGKVYLRWQLPRVQSVAAWFSVSGSGVTLNIRTMRTRVRSCLRHTVNRLQGSPLVKCSIQVDTPKVTESYS